jgi:methyl-accepting chemotaxis protein
LEYFFKRLEKYIEVRPTAAMTDIIVKIMVEVLSILGIVTKEVGQGRTSMCFPVDISPEIDGHAETYLKKLVGRKDVEEALQRLDQLTQEEGRMAATETLTISRSIDDKVKNVGDRVKDVGDKVKDVGDTVKDVGDKVESVDERVQGVDIKVEGIDNQVRRIDSNVQSVDHKVSLVIQGELYLHCRL